MDMIQLITLPGTIAITLSQLMQMAIVKWFLQAA